MWGYTKRLTNDVARWREAGWVTPEGESAILAELADKGGGFRAASVLGVLGAVLLGFALMSFVAANWQEMPRIARLGLLLSLLFASYLAAAAFFERGLDLFAHAAVLLGACVFGASIMLIAQMYHIDGNPPDTALIWAIGALIAGITFRSNPTIALAMILVALWSGWEMAQAQEVHWPFIIGWVIVSAAFVWHRWRPGLHLSAVVLSLWLIAIGFLFDDPYSHEIVVAIGLLVAVTAGLMQLMTPKYDDVARPAICYGVAVAFAALFILQIDSQFLKTNGLWPLAVFSLVMLIAAIAWGLRTNNKGLLWVAYIGFSVEVLIIYFKTIGSLMGTSLFFLTAGLIVIALAAAAFKLHALRIGSQGASQ